MKKLSKIGYFGSFMGSVNPRWLELVSPRGFRWNTLICKLESLDKKLEKLGILEVDGKMVYLQDEEVRNV